MRGKPSSCDACACHDHGTDFTIVEGSCALGVMRVGEASGAHEQREQRPFVEWAPAGGVLQRMTKQMSLDRAQFATTNVLRCRPKGDWLEKAPWEHAAAAQCRANLIEAVRTHKPRCILALGNTAIRSLTGWTGEKRTVSHLAGYVLPALPEFGEGIPVVPTFHPSYLRRGVMALFGMVARHQRRALNVAAGRDSGWSWEELKEAADGGKYEEGIKAAGLKYQAHPSLDEAWGFYQRLRDNAGAVLSYDIETGESASLDEDARDGYADTVVRLIQFSMEAGSGIALPFAQPFLSVARAILGLPNVKCGHNVWLFDNKVLAAAGSREGDERRYLPVGTVHDTLQMYHWWQPDLPAHLQFAASFVNFPFPWKHLAGTDLELYGCADVDATLRLYQMLEATLRRDGLFGEWRGNVGYLGQVAEVRPVLAEMEQRGVPIDNERRLALDAEFRTESERCLTEDIWPKVPTDCHKVEAYSARTKLPPELRLLPESEWDKLFREPDKLDPKTKRIKAGKWYRYRRQLADEAGVDAGGNPVVMQAERWCCVWEFNPNSPEQLKDYMRAKGHPVPRDLKKETASGEAAETTAKKELQRLARKVGDDFYLKVIEYRELGKARATYVEGFKPQPDGRVHTTFTFDTGTGQLSSRNPNVQNFPKHGRLAAALRGMVAAPAGYVLTEWDFKSYHVLTTGLEAESAAYMRMARLDMHSFIAGCFLKLWTPTIMEESDESLLDRFRWLKKDDNRKRTRDKQAKPSILGVGFGMAKRRLYQENLESFPDERTAGRFLDLLRTVFPEVFAWQDRVRLLAHEQQYLRSRFGAVRRFYEVFVWNSKRGGWTNGDQAEEAVAFLPANHAFGGMRLKYRALRDTGMAERYGLFNTVHDSVQFCLPVAMLPQHIADVGPLLCSPIEPLAHPRLAPGGLVVDVELAVGPRWSEMHEHPLPAAAQKGGADGALDRHPAPDAAAVSLGSLADSDGAGGGGGDYRAEDGGG